MCTALTSQWHPKKFCLGQVGSWQCQYWFKGTVSREFRPFFGLKDSTWAPYEWICKLVCFREDTVFDRMSASSMTMQSCNFFLRYRDIRIVKLLILGGTREVRQQLQKHQIELHAVPDSAQGILKYTGQYWANLNCMCVNDLKSKQNLKKSFESLKYFPCPAQCKSQSPRQMIFMSSFSLGAEFCNMIMCK